ncbi:MAG: hypothetical protein ACU0CJ_02270 [Sulfitobacter sp.]|jgi:hypothetical protein|uniref:hypothetical protein n=1 Tax=unclassified Sulfitobacter TaxID=196795 RepID=UPI0007C32510|nr:MULTISPECIES: hypothetical protein [unclassified Sulfitobacter]KZX92679.1 hypothetical protein A3720_06545 [Sulfitobacter sp. HI0021]KZY03521.1 hypothetical protein A3722_03720 [Sulfitobacter sp. HI0027]KZZ01509.1 hypothetical protein A3747_03500 [Sulfitobacter sp. HI0076]
MPLQNRVQPDGEIIAHPARGGFMGNRGILHDENGLHHKRRWAHKNWVCCVLSFKGRRRQLMALRHYTELFFLDEAVAFAAGHRPCAECRAADYRRFRACCDVSGPAAALDRQLHSERAVPRVFQQRRQAGVEVHDLPDGAFILDHAGQSGVLFGDAFHPYRPSGYGPAQPRPWGCVTLLTPPSSVAAFRNGYRPQIALKDAGG